MNLDPQESILSGCFDVIRNFVIVLLSLSWSCVISYLVARVYSTAGVKTYSSGSSVIFNPENFIALAGIAFSFISAVFCLIGLYKQKIPDAVAMLIVCVFSMPTGWLIAMRKYPDTSIQWEKTMGVSFVTVAIPALFYGFYIWLRKRQWESELAAVYRENHPDKED